MAKYVILAVILILAVSNVISYTYTLITGRSIEEVNEKSFSWILASTLLHVNNSMLKFIIALCRVLWCLILTIGILLYFLGLKQLGYKIAILALLLAVILIVFK